MTKSNKIHQLRMLNYAFFLLFLSSCMQGVYEEKDPTTPPVVTPDGVEIGFNHSTIEKCTLNVKYNMSGEIPFRIYITSPFQVVDGSEVFNEEAEPYFAAFTHEDGTYSAEFSLPTSVKEVYVYTGMLGLPQWIKQEVENNTINVDLTTPLTRSAASYTRATHAYPKDMLTLGEWTSGRDGGRPSYLLSEKADIPDNLLTRVNKMLNNGRGKIQESYPELFDNAVVSLSLTKRAAVKMAFIAEYASFRNMIGYYHYPTGSKPAEVSKATLIIAYPNFSDKSITNQQLSGSMELRDQILLKYWNGTSFEDEFPEGTTIEYFLYSNGYSKEGDISTGIRQHYSDPELNKNTGLPLGKEQRCVTLFEYETGFAFVSFEDQKGEASTENFRDAVFALQVNPADAIGGGGSQIPEGDNEPVIETYTRKGTLAFEDLWPYQGDYDLNDVIVDYKSIVSLTAKGVIRTDDQFTMNWSGGSIKSGFGYQLDMPTYKVRSTKITPELSSVPKTKGLENGQEKATIILFDDSHTTKGQVFSIQTVFVDPMANIEPPYNPFIIPGLGSGKRETEVHLPGYQPTSLANIKLFNTGHDHSDVSKGIYYISGEKYPFAIHLPNVLEIPFSTPKEAVRIDQSYPRYSKWVESQGTENKDWYLFPQEGEVIKK